MKKPIHSFLCVAVSMVLILLLTVSSAYAQESVGLEKTWGGTHGDYAAGVAVDKDGNIYVVGETYSFGAGNWDTFVVKYNSAGVLQWQKTWGGTKGDLARGVAVDKDGNIYVVGVTDSFGAPGNFDTFVVKYNSAGVLQWQKTRGGTGYDGAYGAAVDGDGNIYVAGLTESFGAGEADAFVVKYGPGGVLQWQKTWGGTSWDSGEGVASGSVYVVGYTGSPRRTLNDVVGTETTPSGVEGTLTGIETTPSGLEGTPTGTETTPSGEPSGGNGDAFLLSLVPPATVCSVWTTDSVGTPKVEFKPGETVYVHWNANGAVNMTVYAPDGVTVDQQWLGLGMSGVNSFIPTHDKGIYTIDATGAATVTIAVSTFLVIPELPLGTATALTLTLGMLTLFLRRKNGR